MDTLEYGDNKIRISSIIEIDYMKNKYSYNLNKTQKQKELDIVDINPVVEILFSEREDAQYSYRLGNRMKSVCASVGLLIFFFKTVLGEKLNGLAYLERVTGTRLINYNNYSPNLPAWPFAINVTVDMNKAKSGK